jgi:TonB family protein
MKPFVHIFLCALLCGCTTVQKPASHAGSLIAAAVDIKGVRHIGSHEFPGLDEPWIRDRIAYYHPNYPMSDRASRHRGDGLFRITIDPSTGLVSQVAVVKSTGFVSLDGSAMLAIRKWRWKPRTWKEVDIPIRFTMSR